MNWIVLGIGMASGIVFTLTVCGFWYKHNKKKLNKVLNYFDVQARVDELLAKTDLDEKLIETLKEIREKMDKVI